MNWQTSIEMWIIFWVLIIALLIVDLGILHKKQISQSFRKSMALSAVYVAVGIAFSGWIYIFKGAEGAQTYLIGYLVEKSLSLDNIFVISLIFSAFNIPSLYQHRVLFWGILGVIFLRGLMIAGGSILIHQFDWITVVFAAFLVFTGVKMLTKSDKPLQIKQTYFYKWLAMRLRLTPKLHQEKFLVWQENTQGKKIIYVTPLFIALILIEVADLIFAIDSIPAIFSITTDTYIVYTSNIFAILGLRSLYFALAHLIERFIYLKHALALILIFIGGKAIAVWGLPIEKVPATLSLGVILVLLGGGIGASLCKSAIKT